MTGACRPTPLEEIIAKALRDVEDKIEHSRAFNELHTKRGEASIRAMAVRDALLAEGQLVTERDSLRPGAPDLRVTGLLVTLVADKDTT